MLFLKISEEGKSGDSRTFSFKAEVPHRKYKPRSFDFNTLHTFDEMGQEADGNATDVSEICSDAAEADVRRRTIRGVGGTGGDAIAIAV